MHVACACAHRDVKRRLVHCRDSTLTGALPADSTRAVFINQAKGGRVSDSFVIAAAPPDKTVLASHLSHRPPGLHRRLLSFTHQPCRAAGSTRARRHLPQTSPCDLAEKMRAVSPLLDVTSNAGLTEQPSSGQNIPGS